MGSIHKKSLSDGRLTLIDHRTATVTGSRLGAGLSVAFACIAVVMVVLAAIARTPIPLPVAIAFGLAAYLLRLETGDRPPWPLSNLMRRPSASRADPRRPSARFGSTASTRRDRQPHTSESIDAYRVLGVEPGADQAAIRAAYRDRIKRAHPDTSTGDEETFRRVRAAYDRLRE